MANEIKINDVVAGRVGYFVVLGFRTISDVDYAQVKTYDIKHDILGVGELALPVSILTTVKS